MNDQAIHAPAPCSCNSGLLNNQCCAMTEMPLPNEHLKFELEKRVASADTARQQNKLDVAEKLYLDILRQHPGHMESLFGLAQLKKTQGVLTATESLLKRCLHIDKNSLLCTTELAMTIYQLGRTTEAEAFARNGIRLGPRNAQAHNIMGMVLTDMGRQLAGEYHYRKAIELHRPLGKLCANLALNLRQQGRLDESAEWYVKANEMEPDNISTLSGWIKLEELRRDFNKAFKLLDRAMVVQPNSAMLKHTRSALLARKKQYDEALACLDELEKNADEGVEMGAGYYHERALILDKMGRYDEAFENYSRSNELICAMDRGVYREEQAQKLTARLKYFFTKTRYELLPRSPQRKDVAQPIFIIGFPRSGTTMTEQIMTSHKSIVAGDELYFTNDLARFGPKLLNSPLPYPDCFADLWMGDNQESLDSFRDYYLKRSEQLGLFKEGNKWFTDKMPLNEMHLGMMSMVFPESPIIHLHRHPLDVVLSTFFVDLTHGFNCSFKLENAAKHYALVMDLVNHYLSVLDIKYKAVKYEEIVADQEGKTRELLDFVGVDWDEQCMDFHKNERYARTASYAQVTEKLYTSSVHRYKNYRSHLDKIIPILEPHIRNLGYSID